MFLKIDGIQGESTDNSYKDEIELLSYTWGKSHEAVSRGVAEAK
jgi:type VI protein secretion system component Hcp